MKHFDPNSLKPEQAGGREALYGLLDEEWNYRMSVDPASASQLGDDRWSRSWPRISLAAQSELNQYYRRLLARLEKIETENLSRAEELTLGLFRRECTAKMRNHDLELFLIPVTQRNGVQLAHEVAWVLTFGVTRDYEDWIGRLEALPTYIDQTIELMRYGIHRKVLLPKIITEKVISQIDMQLVVDPEASPFYGPLRGTPRGMDVAALDKLRRAAALVIINDVVPSFCKLHDFCVRDYLPMCFNGVGIWQLPRGREMYEYLVCRETSTALSPDEVHELGLESVKEIREKMAGLQRVIGYGGSLKEFFLYLETDPEFYFADSATLLELYRSTVTAIQTHLQRVFEVLPRTPFQVEAVPPVSAPLESSAHYVPPSADGSRPGRYYVNVDRPELRPKWEVMALSLHEIGHHIQVTLAMEQVGMPNFRRYGNYPAFAEGWALYMESLGEEMGLYGNMYSKVGAVACDMWRALRLVLDTGMHYMKWDRQRAVEFFRENVPKHERNIEGEIDRYLAWPAHALAYKVGFLMLRDMRARASQELKERFEIREFHKFVLESGALPWDILGARLGDWIERKQASGAVS